MSRRKLGYILSTFQRPSQGDIAWKKSPRGTPRMFFTLYTGVAPPIYFLLQALSWWRYGTSKVEEDLLSKSASVTMKQTSHAVLSKKVKRRKIKSVIMHCENLSTSQIGFYSIRIWTLNTLFFHRLIGKITIRKDCQLKFCHEKAFLWQFNKIKKPLFMHWLCFTKTKWF